MSKRDVGFEECAHLVFLRTLTKICFTVVTVRLVKIELHCCKFVRGLQLCAHRRSVRIMSTTNFHLLRIQGHVFSFDATLFTFVAKDA
jgi:hypothetical protein